MKKHTLTLLGGPSELRLPATVLLEAVGALMEGARLAARFAVEGESVRKGPRPAWLEAACDFDVTNLSPGSVAIAMEARTLGEVDAARFGADQGSLFGDADDRFADRTAVDLFGNLLATILEGEPDDVVADRALLESCARFAKAFGKGFAGLRLDGLADRKGPVTITAEHVQKIETLRDETPSPQAARIAGKLDTVSATRPDVVLTLKDGSRVPGRMEEHDLDELRALLGKDVVVSGMAHYRPSGRLLFVSVEDLAVARPEDRMFQRVPMGRKRRVVIEPSRQDGTLGVSSFFGTWPGDETDEELLEALRDIG